MWTLYVTGRELSAWNIGVWLACGCLFFWWRSDGAIWWANRGLKCRDCGRPKASCSCVDVVFTADDVWGDDDDEVQ